MSYSLNSLKGGYVGVIKVETRSLDYGSDSLDGSVCFLAVATQSVERSVPNQDV